MAQIPPERSLRLETVSEAQQYDGNFLLVSGLHGFRHLTTSLDTSRSGRKLYQLRGSLREDERKKSCPDCGGPMHVHGYYTVRLRHLPLRGRLTMVSFRKLRYYCPDCRSTEMQDISFKTPAHAITLPLARYTQDLLSQGVLKKEASRLTGLGQNTVRELENEWLAGRNGKKEIEADADHAVRFLGICDYALFMQEMDAFSFMDMETGHLLWFARGSRRQAVTEFLDHFGPAWTRKLQAVACDWNSDVQEVIARYCPRVQPVFHIPIDLER